MTNKDSFVTGQLHSALIVSLSCHIKQLLCLL